MVTGVTGAWGYPIQSIAGMSKTMVNGDHPLTYEFNLSSYPPTFKNGQFISPLYSSNQVSAPTMGFGRKTRKTKKTKKTVKRKTRKSVKRFSKKVCRLFLKNKSKNPVTGRKIKRSGKTYKKFVSECKRHKLIKQKKKL